MRVRRCVKCDSFVFCAGLIHRREGRDDEAMADFRRASELGSGFARSILAQFNPYAAMCNKMLRNVFQVGRCG